MGDGVHLDRLGPGGVGGVVAVPVGQAREPLVEPRELGVEVVQRGFLHLVRGARQVELPAGQAGAAARAGPSVREGEEGRRVVQADLGHDLPVRLPGVHRVEDIARTGGEPADGGDIVAPLHQAHIGRLLRLPGIARQALHGPLEAAGQRHDREQHVVLGDQEVMDHGRVGRLEVGAVDNLAGRIGDAVAHGGGEGMRPDAISEPDHLAGLWIQLGMGGDPAGILGRIAPRLEGVGIDLEGHVPLLEGQQAAGVEQDVGIGHAAVLPGRQGVAEHGIEAAEEGAAMLVLELPLRGADIAVAIGGLAPAQPEGVDHAVAGEPVVVRVEGLELGVRPGAVEGAFKAGRDLPDDLEVEVIL